MLSKTLGARYLVVCVNKMDSCDWSEERYNYIKEKTQDFLTRNCGFESQHIRWVCVEGLTGNNIKDPITNVDWYKG